LRYNSIRVEIDIADGESNVLTVGRNLRISDAPDFEHIFDGVRAILGRGDSTQADEQNDNKNNKTLHDSPRVNGF
jgi:hypothetical protein